MQIDQKLSKDAATRIAMLVLGDGKSDTFSADSGGTTSVNTNSVGLGDARSLREYLDQHEARKIAHEIVGIGAYHQEKNRRNFFTKEELERGFEEASSSVPKNLSRDLKNTIGRGWISPKSGARDQYYVTNTGIHACNNVATISRGKHKLVPGATP